VRVPRHEPGPPPETLTDTDYANLLRVPDRRTLADKRDYALLRVLGDCGLRSAELRGLRARDLRRPLSAVGVHRLVRRSCAAAGVPERLAHPHGLRAYRATHCLEAGVPVHTVSARLGHVDLRTAARYAAPRSEHLDEIADLLDRRHQAARRAGGVV
jgi:integrase